MLRQTFVVFALLLVTILAIVSSASAIPCKQSCVKKCEDAETAHEECIKKCIPACKRDKKNDHLAKLSEMQKRQQEVESEEKKLEDENKAYFEREERLALLKLTNRAQYERLIKQEKERKEKEHAAKVAAEEKQRDQMKAQERTHRQEMEVREVQLHRTQKDINNRLLKLLLAIRHKRGHNVELGFAGEMQLNSKLNILVDRVYRERRFRQHSCVHSTQCAANAASSGQCSCHCDTGMDLDEWWYSNDNRTDAMNNNARYDYINHPELFLRDFPGDMTSSPVPSKSGAAGAPGSGATAQQQPMVQVRTVRHPHKWREEDEDDELVLQTKGLTRSFLNACASANQVCQTPEAYSIKAFCRKFVRLCTPYGLYRRKF